jgi:hypothetical protein
VKLVGWIVVGLVCWTVLVGVVARSQQPDILCARGGTLGFTEEQERAACESDITRAQAAVLAKRMPEIAPVWAAGAVLIILLLPAWRRRNRAAGGMPARG